MLLMIILFFRTLMVSDNFVLRILNFDSESVRPETVRALEKYLNNPDLEFEKVNRASVACGPMIKWLKSQILYSSILSKVDPLKKEMESLSKETGVKSAKCDELETAIKDLESQVDLERFNAFLMKHFRSASTKRSMRS